MDLSEFVSQALTQIATGVSGAQESVSTLKGEVSPKVATNYESASRLGLVHTDNGPMATIVQFDVALTVTQGTGTKGGIGVIAGAFTLGTSGESSAENTSVSRVKFSAPMVLPVPRAK
jgi:hypothetical protein